MDRGLDLQDQRLARMAKMQMEMIMCNPKSNPRRFGSKLEMVVDFGKIISFYCEILEFEFLQ